MVSKPYLTDHKDDENSSRCRDHPDYRGSIHLQVQQLPDFMLSKCFVSIS